MSKQTHQRMHFIYYFGRGLVRFLALFLANVKLKGGENLPYLLLRAGACTLPGFFPGQRKVKGRGKPAQRPAGAHRLQSPAYCGPGAGSRPYPHQMQDHG